MKPFAKITVVICCGFVATLAQLRAATDAPRLEEKDKEKRAVEKQQKKVAQSANVEINGATAFKDAELRTQLKEQIAAIEEFGLTAARADDAAFFLELFYRKHGYSKVDVHYSLNGSNGLRLDITEGPLVMLGAVNFVGNEHQSSEKLFEYAVGPTRERYSKTQRKLPFVSGDLEEGVDLVHRVYVADGFLDSIVQAPHYAFSADGMQVEVTIAIVEGRRYLFGDITFGGNTIYDAETLRGQILDLLEQPYTESRVADVPRRLQSYFKTRGYYDVKVDATGEIAAAHNGAVPLRITIAPGPLYHFEGVSVTGLERLRPGYVTNRFAKLNGKIYSPEAVDEKFRALMRTGLFNILQIKPVPKDGNALHLQISAEEAKSKELGLSVGYGTYVGAVVGASYSDRNLFGYGRPLTTSAEYSTRGYKGEILFEDPYLFNTELHLRTRLGALTYDFDGYSKFEVGARIELEREFTKKYKIAGIFAARRVKVTSASIDDAFLGRRSYLVNSIGFTQTLDLRESPFVAPRGFVFDNTFDLAANAIGSQIEFARSTFRASYYLPFGPRTLTPGVKEDLERAPLRRFFQQSSLAIGARTGIIHALGDGEVDGIPIDERFFNGGSTTVRSFAERDLGPHDDNNPIGGEFFTVFNIEYTFPIFGELQGAVFADAGNLLPSSENPGLDDLRYALGVGLRYKLPIGPIRIDYGVNPAPRSYEDAGAFHFSFGFAF